MSPKVCSLEDDLQGMNLSLQDEVFEGEDKLDIALGDDTHVTALKELEEERVSSLKEVSFIPDGRFRPLFLLGVESIFV